MIRFLLVTVVLAALPVVSLAEETTVRLSVRPMSAPKPALKYLLLPEVRELTPGNSVQWYVRCFQEQRNFFFNKAAASERLLYQSMPLAELPAEKLRNYGGYALRQADWAARMDTTDWEILQRLQSGGTELRQPELGPMRILGVALQVRFRGEVAGRRFDDAVATAKTMFAFARQLGQCPSGAANRLGMAVADLTLDTLEEMVRQPGSPNLYWALTDLPCPLVNLRKGLQGDAVLATADLRRLRDEPMTETEIDAVVGRISGAIGFAREQAGLPPQRLRAELRARVKDTERVRAARGRLVEAGCAEELVRKFPPMQVLLLDEKRELQIRRDERMKNLNLAPWQMTLVGGKEAGTDKKGPFDDLLPDVVKVRLAQARVEQRVALMRHIEALRMYAAAREGKLPARLSDCSVPLPDDPFTGKPFRYEMDGAVAHLRGSPSADKAKSPAGIIHYQVTVR